MPWLTTVDDCADRFSLPGIVRDRKMTPAPFDNGGRRECCPWPMRGARRRAPALTAGCTAPPPCRAQGIGRRFRYAKPARPRDSRFSRATPTMRQGAATTTTSRFAGFAASATERRRATFDANVGTATRPAKRHQWTGTLTIRFRRASGPTSHRIGRVARRARGAGLAERAAGLVSSVSRRSPGWESSFQSPGGKRRLRVRCG